MLNLMTLSARQEEGLLSARARGRVGGRPKILDKKKRKLVAQLYRKKEHTLKEIISSLDTII